MDPLSRFEADRYNAACKTIKEEMAAEGTRDYVKLYNATLRLPRSEWHLANVALEAELPPVSERLTGSELRPSSNEMLVGYRLEHGPRARYHAMAEEKEDVGSKAQRLFG